MEYTIRDNIIKFNDKFNKPIDIWIKYLTDSISIIDLSEAFDYNYLIDNLSNLLNEYDKQCIIKQIKFGRLFSHRLDSLPNSLQVLDLSSNDKFDYPLDNLPESLIILKTGWDFNHPLDNLPNGLRILDLNSSLNFNHTLDKLPESVTVLKLKGEFNHRLDNLPNRLKTLEINEDFSHEFANLPNSIKNLVISCPSNKKINSLPSSLENLTLHYNKCKLDINIIPETLEKINLFECELLNKNEIIELYPQIEICHKQSDD